MRKTLVGFAIGLFATAVTVEAYAISLVYHSTGQLGGINDVDINGTLYDATFHNQWSLSGRQTYAADFSQDASSALRTLWLSDPLLHFDYFASADQQKIWGCEYQQTPCNLITPIFDGTTTFDCYDTYGYPKSCYNIRVRGFQYIVGSTVTDSGYLYLDQHYTFSWVQWTESTIVDEGPKPPIIEEVPETPTGGTVPEPGTLALLGLSLVGLLAVNRRRH